MRMEEDWLGKLELLKDLKTKTEELSDMRRRLVDCHNRMRDSERLLADFRNEVDALEQEKQKHTDIIRAINKDLEEMNGLIKRTEEDRIKYSRTLSNIAEDFVPAKDEVDKIRRYMEVEPTPDLAEDGISVSTICPERVENPPIFMGVPQPTPDRFGLVNSMNFGQPTGAVMTASGMNQSFQHSLTGLGGPTIPFRQKPAPMKICPTCSSEIHRNAPICPTCKSKSHSKNPKKSKRKNP